MLCPSCGHENREGAQFCTGCGAGLETASPAQAAAKPDLIETLKKYKVAIAGGAGGLLLLCLLAICVAAAVVFVVPGLTGGSEMLVAFPDRGGEVDLYLLKLGQDKDEWTLLAEDARSVPMSFLFVKGETYQGEMGGSYGGFLPDSDRLFLWYRLDDDTMIQQMRVGDREPVDVLESRADYLAAGYFVDSAFFAVREMKDDQARCYVARLGQEAERLTKADDCFFSLDGRVLVYEDEDGDGETTLAVVDVARQEEEVLVDRVEGLESVKLSADGSHVAYVQGDSGEHQLFLIERRSGEETEVTDEVAGIYDFGFVPHSDTLYYIVKENEDDDEVQLYTLLESDRSIAEGTGIHVGFSSDGRYMFYVVMDDDGEETLYARPVEGGDEVEVAQGDDIAFEAVRTSPARLLAIVLEDDEVALLSADLSGNDVVELWSDDDVELGDGMYVINKSTLYLRIENKKDGADALFVTPVNKDTGFYLLEDWASIRLMTLSSNDRTLVVSMVEDSGDDPVLHSVEVRDGAEPVELDNDAEGFVNAVFTSDDRYVIYTSITGDGSDDREIRKIRADGAGKYESLYEEAMLIDARWADRNRFRYFR
jgi:hypothetical protein